MERISPLATRSRHEKIAVLDEALVRTKIEDARRNARLREIHCFHQDDGERLHRMLNAMEPGTYIRPHRHLDPPKAESVVVLSGALGLVLFDDDGNPLDDDFVLMSNARGVIGIDLRPAVWHTLLTLETGTVMFEVKPGPYQSASDKDFAVWAPQENTPEADVYLAGLEARFRKRFDL
jgi:cupin fold WbuC family metalloprotein